MPLVTITVQQPYMAGDPMKTRASIAAIALTTLVWITGCSSEQLYATGRNTQRVECMKQPDAQQRERCLKDAGLSYDRYKSETDAASK